MATVNGVREFVSSEEQAYSNLSSVSWVNSKWLILSLSIILTITIIPAVLSYSEGSLALMLLLGAGCVVLAFPYIHYRVNGGTIRRLPFRVQKNI